MTSWRISSKLGRPSRWATFDLLAGEEVVQADHVVPLLDQPLAEVRAEKAGPAGHQNSFELRHGLAALDLRSVLENVSTRSGRASLHVRLYTMIAVRPFSPHNRCDAQCSTGPPGHGTSAPRWWRRFPAAAQRRAARSPPRWATPSPPAGWGIGCYITSIWPAAGVIASCEREGASGGISKPLRSVIPQV